MDEWTMNATVSGAEKSDAAQQMVMHLPEALCFEYDFAGDRLYLSDACADLLGVSTVMPHFFQTVSLDSLPAEHLWVRLHDIFISQDQEGKVEARALLWDGTPAWFSILWKTAGDPSGARKVFGIFRNIDNEKKESVELQRSHPYGVPDTAETEEVIRAGLSRIRSGHSAALIAVNVDGFHALCADFGVQAGELVLRKLAGCIREIFPGSVIGFDGADEFQIFTAEPETVRPRAASLCRAVANLYPDSEASAMRVSVSVGIAFTEESGSGYERLRRHADVALYIARMNGRNRYEVYGDGIVSGVSEKTGSSSQEKDINLQQLLEILFMNVQKGENGLLNALAAFFHVDRIFITKIENGQEFPDAEWTDRPEWRLGNGWSCPGSGGDPVLDGLELCCCPDLSMFPQYCSIPPRSPRARALLQCGILKRGEAAGHIGLECGSRRLWSRGECEAIRLVAGVLGERLANLKDAEEAYRISDDLAGIIDALPGYVYAIDERTMQLAFCNRPVRDRFPHAAFGMTCHQAFCGNGQKCFSCPVDKAGECGSVMMEDSPFGERMDIATSTMQRNGVPLRIVSVTPHVMLQGEKIQRQRQNTLLRAMRSVYDTVLDVDAETGRLVRLSVSPNLPYTDRYEDCLSHVCAQCVDPQEADALKKEFSLPSLYSRFDSGEREVIREYRIMNENGAIRWKRRRAAGYCVPEGGKHILICSRDVTDRHENEDRRSRAETKASLTSDNFVRALKSGYALILRLDVAADRGTVIQDLYGVAQHIQQGTSFSRAILSAVRNGAVPSDGSGRFLDFFDLRRIAQYLDDRKSGQDDTSSTDISIQGADGMVRCFQSRILDLAGEPGKALILCRDITESRRLVGEQKRLERRLRTMLRYACSFAVEVNMLSGEYVLRQADGENMMQIPERGDYAAQFRRMLEFAAHPDDWEAMRDTLRFSKLKALCESGRESLCRFRLARTDGENYEWMECRLIPFTEHGVPLLLCLMRNVTREMLLEQEKKAFERLSGLLIPMACDGVVHVYPDTGLYEYTPLTSSSKKRVFLPNRGEYELFFRIFLEKMVHPDDRPDIIRLFSPEILRTSMRRPGFQVGCRFRETGMNRNWLFREATGFWAADENGARFFCILLRDVPERQHGVSDRKSGIGLE
ncbi:MAG: GGDEF domain-containing protein [Desulfovibrionaceae bacterium]|nr:GGDEF domain-containing protein [Desulfovibrionaceae bacterium]